MIDWDTRKAVALWCRVVALEDPSTTDHLARAAIAKTMLESISPTAPADSAASHVVFLVRAFLGDEAEMVAIEATVEQIMGVFLKLAAFGA